MNSISYNKSVTFRIFRFMYSLFKLVKKNNPTYIIYSYNYLNINILYILTQFQSNEQ
jgi:hypothetical protein